MGPEALGSMFAAPAMLGAFAAAGFIAFSYFLLTLDRGRTNSPSKDDTQAGIKVVLFALIIAGVATAAGGLHELLAYALGGFKGGSGPVKQAMPPLLVGALLVVIAAKAFLPRTNNSAHRQVERYALGLLGFGFAMMTLTALDGVLVSLFNDGGWQMTSSSLAGVVVGIVVAGFCIPRFGSISGWTAPAPPPPQMPQQYPPQGGYPPQGYPPQGGGYPPQGGGYPPQGGGGYPR